MPKPNATRVHGLDTLRALAISLVFLYHYRVFVGERPDFGGASVVGWVGVDLFFVLSGFLIGDPLFSGIARGEALSLKNFYARRAFRTWPTFWVVLAAYSLFPTALGGKHAPPLWTFLTFTQNFGLQPGTSFSHAWSLCIEEQFYFVLPFFALAAARFGVGRGRAWLVLFALLAVGIVSRAVLWTTYGREEMGQLTGYYPKIYYATLCRFDEFLPGIAIALLKNFHPNIWRRVERQGNALLVAGLAATGAMLFGASRFYYIEDYGYGGFMTIFGYSLIAGAFSLLVLAALSPTSWLHGACIPGAAPLARWSYSLYLSHKAVGFAVKEHTALSPIATFFTTILLSLLVGFLLYRLVESPFLALRARWFPSR
jgi:peptidoglycan/LPS O-acetylase OafA/YrhL